MDGAPQWDLSDRPRGVVGQIGGQDADPQLALWEIHTEAHTENCLRNSKLQITVPF